MTLLKLSFRLLFILFIIQSISCHKNISLSAKQLNLIDSYILDIREPSGLSFSDNPGELLTVSDSSKKIFKISLTGEVIGEITPDTDLNDLEGITYNQNEDTITVIQERTRKIIKINSAGHVQKTTELDIPGSSTNKGIEGIAYNKNNNHYYIINEKNPSLLVELDENFNKVASNNLNFAMDYSGIFYDESSNSLWIISHESQSLTKCDLSGNSLESFRFNRISQAEGIVIDFESNRIYIVSDDDKSLYVFAFPEQ